MDEELIAYCWGKIMREVDRCYDVRGSTLAYLARACLMQNGIFTKDQIEQYQRCVPAPVLDFIARLTRRIVFRIGTVAY